MGVELFYLPPHSPDLDGIERVWRSVKYEDHPLRVHTTAEAVSTAVDQALDRPRARVEGPEVNFTKAAWYSGAWAGPRGVPAPWWTPSRVPHTETAQGRWWRSRYRPGLAPAVREVDEATARSVLAGARPLRGRSSQGAHAGYRPGPAGISGGWTGCARSCLG
ncbi:transposase [Streptomyces roseolilacinus]